MSEKKERLRRKLAAGHPPKKQACADPACGWWGLSPVSIRCPVCRGRTATE